MIEMRNRLLCVAPATYSSPSYVTAPVRATVQSVRARSGAESACADGVQGWNPCQVGALRA